MACGKSLNTQKLIKSKQRVKEHGEVFTPDHIVSDMCDMVQNASSDMFAIKTTFLEPACGTGNFLAEIYRRKLERCCGSKDGVTALCSIYGIDIMQDNVDESRKRLYDMFLEKFPNADNFIKGMTKEALKQNIVCGDFLTKLTANGDKIWFLEDERTDTK